MWAGFTSCSSLHKNERKWHNESRQKHHSGWRTPEDTNVLKMGGRREEVQRKKGRGHFPVLHQQIRHTHTHTHGNTNSLAHTFSGDVSGADMWRHPAINSWHWHVRTSVCVCMCVYTLRHVLFGYLKKVKLTRMTHCMLRTVSDESVLCFSSTFHSTMARRIADNREYWKQTIKSSFITPHVSLRVFVGWLLRFFTSIIYSFFPVWSLSLYVPCDWQPFAQLECAPAPHQSELDRVEWLCICTREVYNKSLTR